MFRKLESHFFVGVTKQGLIYFFISFLAWWRRLPLKKGKCYFGFLFLFLFCTFFPPFPLRGGVMVFRRKFFNRIFQRKFFQKVFCFSQRCPSESFSKGIFVFQLESPSGSFSNQIFVFQLESPSGSFSNRIFAWKVIQCFCDPARDL